MPCFSLGFVEQLCVWIICVIALISILKIVLPWLGSMLPSPVAQIIQIILWAIIAIIVVYFIFTLFGCLLGGGGLSLFPRHYG
jgi:hypothetical protein